jgi:pyruvate,water dikinase
MDESSWLIDTQPDNPDLPLWTRSLAAEMLPDAVSPLGWTMVWRPCAATGWRDCMIERFGFDDRLLSPDHPETVAVVGGFAYANASILRVWADRMPGMTVDDIDPVLVAGDAPLPPHVDPPWATPDRVARGMLEQWRDWVVSSRNQFELEQQLQLVAAEMGRAVDLDASSDAQLMERALELQPLMRELFSQHLNQTLAAMLGPRLLNNACVAVGQPAHTLRLLSGLGGIDPVSPTLALWELSRLVRSSSTLNVIFDNRSGSLAQTLRQSDHPDAVALVAGIDALVAEVGFRGPNEWDLASPTWDAVPDVVLAMISSMRRCDDGFAPLRRRRGLEDDRHRLAVEIAGALSDRDRDDFINGLASSTAFLRGRELSRTALMRLLHRMRHLVRELARRASRRGDLEDPTDVWLLRAEELAHYADGGRADVADVVRDRRPESRSSPGIEPPPLVTLGGTAVVEPGVSELRRWMAMSTAEDLVPGDLMLGSPGSPGMAQGPARVIETDDDLALFEPGEIIVLARPDLAATPLFVVAGAVVTDVGDTFTHAVVVARELGIPMVVGAGGASERIVTGSVVNVDGLTGVVAVVPGEAASDLEVRTAV